MNTENQICSLDQAIQLKKLGIDQTSSEFYFIGGDLRHVTSVYDWSDQQLVSSYVERFLSAPAHEIFAAFTTAEIGVMLPNRKIVTYKELLHCLAVNLKEGMIVVSVGGGVSISNNQPTIRDEYTTDPCYTEAYGRTQILITMLENGEITAEEVNKRITNP